MEMFIWEYIRPIWGLLILIVPQVLIYSILKLIFGADGGKAIFIIWIIGFLAWATM